MPKTTMPKSGHACEPPPSPVEERIRKLKERANDLAGGEMACFSSPDLPPEILERFLQNVLAWEEADRLRPFDVLVDGGLELPPADELDDEALATKLGELIEAMAEQGMLLAHTDHLNDRQLYGELLERTLVEEIVLPINNDGPRGYWILDLMQSGGQDNAYLKYYADDDARRDWAERWPDDVIPDHEDPPYNRDRTLP